MSPSRSTAADAAAAAGGLRDVAACSLARGLETPAKHRAPGAGPGLPQMLRRAGHVQASSPTSCLVAGLSDRGVATHAIKHARSATIGIPCTAPTAAATPGAAVALPLFLPLGSAGSVSTTESLRHPGAAAAKDGATCSLARAPRCVAKRNGPGAEPGLQRPRRRADRIEAWLGRARCRLPADAYCDFKSAMRRLHTVVRGHGLQKGPAPQCKLSQSMPCVPPSFTRRNLRRGHAGVPDRTHGRSARHLVDAAGLAALLEEFKLLAPKLWRADFPEGADAKVEWVMAFEEALPRSVRHTWRQCVHAVATRRDHKNLLFPCSPQGCAKRLRCGGGEAETVACSTGTKVSLLQRSDLFLARAEALTQAC